MDLLEGITGQFATLRGIPLIMLLVMIVGWLLKQTPIYPRQYIPHALILLVGPALSWALGDHLKACQDSYSPACTLFASGGVAGFSGFLAHNQVVKRLVDKFSSPETKP